MPRLKKKEPDFIKVGRLIRGYATPPKVAEMLGELNMICRRAHIPAEDMEASIKF